MDETRKALRAGPTMPAFFFGHGNPMNAIQRNAYTEAWAAIEGRPDGDSTLLHYASDPEDPSLNPDRRVGARAEGAGMRRWD